MPLTEAQATAMTSRLWTWLDTLNERSPDGYHFAIEPGRKYGKLVMDTGGSYGRSVHAFYDMGTGDVLKAAGWKAPAKGVRFNLLDDESFERMIEACDWAGRYLYVR